MRDVVTRRQTEEEQHPVSSHRPTYAQVSSND